MAFRDEFRNFPELQTERLVLRSFRPDDAEQYLRLTLDEDVQRYLGGMKHTRTVEEALRWIENMSGRYFSGRETICWALALRDDRLIGRVELAHFTRQSMADLYYHIGQAYWGKGYTTEAVGAAIRFAFDRLELDRVQATVLPENEPSLRVLEKNGFKREGVLRKYSFANETRDTVMLSLIRNDYYQMS